MKKQAVSIVASGILLAAGNVVKAQSTGDQPAPSRRSSGGQQDQGLRGLSTQYLMQHSGGSLLQATQTQPEAKSQLPTPTNSELSLIEVPQTPPHVLKKHDLVNIVVEEASKSESTGSSDLERSVDFDAKVDAFVKLNLAKLSVAGGAEGAQPPEIKLEGQRDFKGTGDYNRSDTVSLRLEAEVIDVKPNGNLVIQARRHIKTDEEDLTVSLTGTCRVIDVDATNSVLSTDLYDLDLEKETKGEVRAATNRGVLHRLLDFFNPF